MSCNIFRPPDADDAIARIRALGRAVVTFVGFSGAGYEDLPAVERAIAAVLDDLSPASALICAGATPDGIGIVYPMAKQRGFATLGIVSTIAEKEGARFSPDVDTVFVVADDTWGGVDANGKLSPASAAIVGAADEIVAIGGGEIARDEIVAARALGKKVRYFAADMDHAAAIRRASGQHSDAVVDFRGAAAACFDRG